MRGENRLLKKRNELLEAESAELADRLVRGQVSRAEEEETSYAIQSELLILRRAHLEISHQLELANEEVRGLSLRLQENVSVYRNIMQWWWPNTYVYLTIQIAPRKLYRKCKLT